MNAWDKALDKGTDAYALDITCLQRGLAAKLKSCGISAPLITLLTDYLKGRSLHVVLNVHSSK